MRAIVPGFGVARSAHARDCSWVWGGGPFCTCAQTFHLVQKGDGHLHSQGVGFLSLIT